MKTGFLHKEENKVKLNSKVVSVAAILVAQSKWMFSMKRNIDKIKVIIN